MYMNSKNIVIAVLLLVLIGAVAYVFSKSQEMGSPVVEIEAEKEVMLPTEPDGGIGDGAEPLPEIIEEGRGDESVLGNSVSGNQIKAYHFGEGEDELLFVGGIHGGYSWNTSLVAFELIEYLKANPSAIPENVSVTIIPVANPDGLKTTIGETGKFDQSLASAISDAKRVDGRFNANNVDLNRNFDCEWKESGVWQSKAVSGGTKAFSEPEAQAIKDYVEEYEPVGAVVWFSAEGKVYPSACGENPSKKSIDLAATFANSANYPVAAEFDAYTITGDMVNWMAKENIPAISVLLSSHQDIELDKNLAGIKAVLSSYSE